MAKPSVGPEDGGASGRDRGEAGGDPEAAVTREFVRRSCGHGETVYATGPSGLIDRRIHAKEKDVCGICRERRKSSDPPDPGKGEDDRKASEEQDLRGEVRAILNERKQSNTNKGDSA
jgi:hypothetical protein